MNKFPKGSLVMVTENLGQYMSHFRSGCLAVVYGTYAEQFGGSNYDSYSLILEGDDSQTSWYHENQLALVDVDGSKYLDEWKEKREIEKRKARDLKLVYREWSEDNPISGDTAVYVFQDVLGLGSIWGSNGEGINAWSNSMFVNEIFRAAKEKGVTPECFDETLRGFKK